jgi:CBS-domain-containing membrane protein
MTRTVVTATEDTPVEEVVDLMERHRIKRVPVVRDRKIIGIVSRANFLRAVARLADDAPALSASDEEIRKKIMTEFNSQAWGKDASINVFVRNGIVHLSGIIFDQRKRQAWRVAAENVPGVKSVEDRIISIDSTSGEALD